MFDALEPEALTRGVAFERGIEPLPTVVTDEGRVQRIVRNLLDNAIHWTPRAARSAWRARPPGGGFLVAVSDTGPGVPRRSRSGSSDPSSSRETPDGRRGCGLGLAICRQLARALGGDVPMKGRWEELLPSWRPRRPGPPAGARPGLRAAGGLRSTGAFAPPPRPPASHLDEDGKRSI